MDHVMDMFGRFSVHLLVAILGILALSTLIFNGSWLAGLLSIGVELLFIGSFVAWRRERARRSA